MNASPRFLRGLLAGIPTRGGWSWEFIMGLSLLALAGLLIAFTRTRLGVPRAKCNDAADHPAETCAAPNGGSAAEIGHSGDAEN